jgi:tetratricopeptide (TPR) repeat protein
MADELAKQILDLINKTEFPTTNELDSDNYKLYMAGHDILLMYRGHPDTLLQAFRVFLMTNVHVYAYAGAARIMMLSGYISGGKYDAWGVNEGFKLLQKAKALMPHRFEIEMIEPEVYNMLRQPAKMRTSLDALIQHPDAPTHFRYAILEQWYWESQNNVALVENWGKRAREYATTNIQKLYAINSLAGMYLRQVRYRQALELYRQVVKLDPNDPWAWHNMSIIYMESRDYNKAFDCNRRALHIMEFGAALNIQDKLVKYWGQRRHDDIIREASPYKVQGQAQEGKPSNFLKKLFNN